MAHSKISMTKTRISIFLLTIIVVGTIAFLVSLYARGYRFSTEDLRFSSNGLFVLKSVPDGASVYLNGELETATNATFPMPPGTYDVRISKEGYMDWGKRLYIEKEIVTEITAHLFKSAPSLSAITFSGITNPIATNDMTKIAYAVPEDPNSMQENDKAGLWVMENVNLPIGFTRNPRRVTDGDLEEANWTWSPDGREILLTTLTGVYLLNASEFTSQAQRVNVASDRNQILTEWEIELKRRKQSKLRGLPEELVDILERKSSALLFSPDKDMIMYTASASATLSENLIKQLPGASTQKQDRQIKKDHTYIYDIKEDRNFLIDSNSETLAIGHLTNNSSTQRLTWFASSRHLIFAKEDKVSILDYDGTNEQVVFSGSYSSPHAFPTLSTDRILILTSLGANSTPNLYLLSLN